MVYAQGQRYLGQMPIPLISQVIETIWVRTLLMIGDVRETAGIVSSARQVPHSRGTWTTGVVSALI